MKIRFLAGSVAALGLMAGMAPGGAKAEYVLHVLHTNDLHSRIEPINKYDSTCAPEDDAAGECFGGIARVATKVRELREQITAEGGNVILLDAGDQFQGSLFYTTYKGDDTAEFMNAIGYDVMAVGNHEFDDGPAQLDSFIGQVMFPLTSGNLDLSQSAELKGKVSDTVILEVGGEKIGIVSALATDTPETSSPGPNVIFQDEIDSLSADAEALTEEGVTKIIALTHVGVVADQRIAEAVPNIDAVVGGHSHTLFSNTEEGAMAYPTMVGDVPVVSAYAYSKYLGHLVLTFDDAGTLISAEGEPVLLDASVTPDPEITAKVQELSGPLDEVRSRVVAQVSGDIEGSREVCRAMECQMGNLVADAMVDRVKDQGVTIAITNGGGLRSSIAGGEVTMGDVLSVLPFQNTLATFEGTGQMVIDALENGASQMEEGAGRFSQVSGLKYTVDPAAEAGARISDVMVEEGGEWVPIDPAKTYGIATNNYVRNGGDGYGMFVDAQKAYDFGPDLADVTAEYLMENGPYEPYTDGRITVK